MKLLVFLDRKFEGVHPPREFVVPCTRDMIVQGLAHQRFYVIRRSLRSTFGPWPVIRFNGEDHVIDPSVPYHVDEIPSDAIEIEGELREAILHDSSGYHAWAGAYLPQVEALFVVRDADRKAKRR